MYRSISALAGCCLVLAGSATALAQPAPAPDRHNRCFYVNQFQNWRAADNKTIYIRVSVDRFYRLDLTASCPAVMWPDSHLIMNIHGPDTICSAVDWDLKVAQSGPGGMAVPCIVKSMTELSPTEAAAIPKKFKP